MRNLINSKTQDDLGQSTAPAGQEVKPRKKVYESVQPHSNDHQELRAYRTILEQASQKALAESRALEKVITAELQSLPTETWANVKQMLFQESAVEMRPALKHVLQAYASKTFHKVFSLNPSLTSAQVETLLQDVTAYLIRSTYYFQMEETIRTLNVVLKNPDEENMQRFFQTATALRNYKIEDHPDYLVFEYMMRILIRKDQIENLAMLTGEKTTLLEMIMGAGKTSVLLPLASHANAVSGKRLSMVVLPEALVPSMVKQLSSQLDQVFGQGVDRITIQRKDKYNLSKLQHLYSRLRKDLDTERVIVTSNNSIQSLFLIFIESLYDYQDLNVTEERTRAQEVAALQDIFSLFRNYAYVLIDEVDSILDIMASHRFSVGHRGRLEPSIVNATAGLYQLLAEDTQIRREVKIPFIREIVPGAKPFSRDAYEKSIKDRLIDLVCRPRKRLLLFR